MRKDRLSQLRKKQDKKDFSKFDAYYYENYGCHCMPDLFMHPGLVEEPTTDKNYLEHKRDREEKQRYYDDMRRRR